MFSAVRPIQNFLRVIALFFFAMAAITLPAVSQTATSGSIWGKQTPATVPPARHGQAMAYDATHRQVVLFGGYQFSSSSYLNDTWTYDGTTWTQHTGPAPAGRSGAGMAYDPTSGQVLLFGGTGDSGYYADTWLWNGTSWAQQQPGGGPTGRYRFGMAADLSHNNVVLFGGSDANADLGDTWLWATGQWTQQTTNTHPSTRYGVQMAYNNAAGNVVLFGGDNNNDTWIWNGSTWAQQTTATAPDGRNSGQMAFDSDLNGVVLFGGDPPPMPLNDTWLWNGTAWSQLRPVQSPQVRQEFAMVYDEALRAPLLFGGYVVGAGESNDTWLFQAGRVTATATAIGSTTTVAVPFQITGTGVLPALSNNNVLTQGAPGLDFTLGAGSTCTGAVTANSSCVVNVNFAPRFAGQRLGAVTLLDNNGATVATALVSGTGTGPQVTFASTAVSRVALGSGFSNPIGVAVDGVGNVYVADAANNAVKQIVAVGGTVPANPTIRTLGSGFSSPDGLAVDGAGNVYVADTQNNAVKEILAVGGTIPANPTIRTLGSGFSSPDGLAVDGAGNVYVADFYHNAVKEIVAVGGTIPANPTIQTLGSGFSYPYGLAVDSAGNVYVADLYDNAVKQIVAVNGTIPSNPTIRTLSSGYSPFHVAVDGAGNVYFSELNTNTVKEIVAVGGTVPANATVRTLSSGFVHPLGVALDGAGNVYVADGDNNTVEQIPLATPPALSFADTAAGATSSDSPKTVTVQNIGNAALTFPIPSMGSDPSISANYYLSATGSTACPQVTSGSSSPASLASGAVCDLVISFTPGADLTSTATVSGTLNLTDDNLNLSGATQSIALAGKVLAIAITPAAGALPNATVNQNYSQTFTGSGGTAPYTFAITGGALPPNLSLSNGGVLSGLPQTAGNYSFTITASDANQVQRSANYTLQVALPPSAANSSLALSNAVVDVGADGSGAAVVRDTAGNGIAGASVTLTFTLSSAQDAMVVITAGATQTTAPQLQRGHSVNISGTTDATGTLAFTVRSNVVSSLFISGSFTVGSVSSNFTQNPTISFVQPLYRVTTLADDAGVNGGAGVAANCPDIAVNPSATGTNCSLRDAVAAANAQNASTVPQISFDPALTANATTANPSVLTLGGAEIVGTHALLLNGPGVNQLTISGNNASRIFSFSGSDSIGIAGVTLTQGNGAGAAGNGTGGAIYTSAPLNLTNMQITASSAQTNGGAIFAEASAPLTILRATFANNKAPGGYGGAIDALGTLSLTSSTLTANTAALNGGGVSISPQIASIVASTIAGNQSLFGRGGGVSGSVNATNSIIAGNTAPGSGNPNVSGNYGGSGNYADTDQFPNPTLDPMLSALTTSPNGSVNPPVLIPLPGSPVICLGTAAGNTRTTDQRGSAPSQTYGSTACVDAGAVQTHYALAFTQQPGNVRQNQAMSPAPVVSLTENGAAFTAASETITLTQSGSGSLTGNSAATATTGASAGSASFGSLAFDTAQSPDSLTASLSLNASPSTTLTSAASSSFSVTPAATQLRYIAAPPATVTAGGNAGTITVSEADANGNAVYATGDAIALTVTGPSGYTQTYNANLNSSGLAVFDLSNVPLTVAGTYTYTATRSGTTPAVASESVAAAAASKVATVSGSGQSAGIAKPFGAALMVSVTDAYGNPVGAGTSVIFRAPATGASATFTPSTGTTQADSTAQVSATANGTVGQYSVLATVANGTVSATFALSNTPGSTTIAAPATYTTTYNSGGSFTVTVSGQGTAPGGNVTYTIGSGTPQTAPLSSGKATIVIPTNQAVTTGTTITISYGGDANNNAAQNVTTQLIVNKATAQVTLGSLSAMYDGKPHAATATTTPAGLNVALTYNGSATAPTAAGNYTVVATVNDANYTGSATGTLVISQAAAAITFTVPNHTYGDAPFTVSASSASTGSFTYAVVSGPATVSGNVVTLTGAGTVTLRASQAADANYAASTQTASFSVSPAVTVAAFPQPTSVVYGTALGAAQLNASATAAGIGPVPGSFTYTPVAGTVPNAGTVTLSAQFTPLNPNNFTTPAAVTTTLTVAQAPTTTVVTTSASPVLERVPVTFTATVKTTAGGTVPAGTVTFSDGATVLGTATLNASGVATYTATAGFTGTGNHTITAAYAGNSNQAASSGTVTEAIGTASTLVLTDAGQSSFTATVQRGLAVQTTVTLSTGATFAGTVTFSCSGLPANVSCAFTPSSVTLAQGAGAQSITLLIRSASLQTAMLRTPQSDERTGSSLALAFALPGMLLAGIGARSRRVSASQRLLLALFCLTGLAAMAGLTGCGSSSAPLYTTTNAAPGTYTFNVVATSGTSTATLPVTLTIQ